MHHGVPEGCRKWLKALLISGATIYLTAFHGVERFCSIAHPETDCPIETGLDRQSQPAILNALSSNRPRTIRQLPHCRYIIGVTK
jgi:hypothetical protein